MHTPYSSNNAKFSDAAHEAARTLIYPYVFSAATNSNIEAVEYVSTQVNMGGKAAILDGEMAVDRIVQVQSRNFQKPIEFTVQERFRKPQYAGFQDMTITEWNHSSNQPSELYKIRSGLFVYGYYDPDNKNFIDWIVADTTMILFMLTNKSISYSLNTNQRSNQTFICLSFNAMRQAGVVVCEKRDFKQEAA